MLQSHILKYPAPRRESVKTERGYHTKPWSAEGVLSTLRGGGWFGPDHDFEPGVSGFAFDAQDVMEALRS